MCLSARIYNLEVNAHSVGHELVSHHIKLHCLVATIILMDVEALWFSYYTQYEKNTYSDKALNCALRNDTLQTFPQNFAKLFVKTCLNSFFTSY